MGLFDGGSGIFGPVAGLVGGLASNLFNVSSTQATNQTAEEIASANNQNTLMMSDTAHQREVADLKAAGLNPILSGTGGQGASTPAQSMPGLTAPQVQMPDLMSYGVSMKQLDQADQKIGIDRANMVSNIARNVDLNKLTKAQTILAQKGMIPAELEGDAAAQVQSIIRSLKQYFNDPNPKKLLTPPSSGGAFPGDVSVPGAPSNNQSQGLLIP